MTTTQLFEHLERNVAEIAEAMQQLYGLGQFSVELATDASMRSAGAATLLAGIGNILVTKGVCTGAELQAAVKGAEAAGALDEFVRRMRQTTEPESEEEEAQAYPEDAVIFGGTD